MIQAAGWEPGDQMHGMALLELMVKFGQEVRGQAAEERCNYPDCGCDRDSVCADGLRILNLIQATRFGEAGETLETIAEWCEQTFGPIQPDRIVSRAAEEMDELRAEPTKVEEAADVVIVLARYPGLWAEIQRKMKINRARKWRLMGDGTGYHIKSVSDLSQGIEARSDETRSGSAVGKSPVAAGDAP